MGDLSGRVARANRAQEIPRPLSRVAHFESLGFGLFLHWGLYSLPGRGEWVRERERIPPAEYARLTRRFHAKAFDARAWARLAREAGMRYAVLTARHHDGFSLYDTRGLNRFDAPHAAAGRDLVAEFVRGCRAEGVVPFLYHTTLDWWHPDFTRDFRSYLRYLRSSVEILCTRYGPIGGFWFDGNWSNPTGDWEEDELYGVIRRHQPQAIIVNNSGLGALGAEGHPELDLTTFEQNLPRPPDRRGRRKYLAVEMCQTCNRHWGVARHDLHYLSVVDVISQLATARGAGANFLLNIGPNADGSIPDLEGAMLRRVGTWVRLNSAWLYDARPAALVSATGDVALRRGRKLYLGIRDLGVAGSAHTESAARRRVFTGRCERVRSVRWLDNGESLNFKQTVRPGRLSIDATDHRYGEHLVVRVAECTLA